MLSAKKLFMENKKVNTTILKPLAILSGIAGAIVVMAGSDVLDPLIAYIHNPAITPFESMLCLLFTLLGFAGCYFALNTLCTYFVPRMKSENKHTQKRVKNNTIIITANRQRRTVCQD
jgi:amino acid transporter